MANTTDVMAKSVHGTNPQNMVEYIIRQKIYDSMYWKQDCFGLTAELLVDKGVELRYVGGMYGDPQKPSEFLCLILKMLQIQPDKDIIVEFIKDDEFKYLRLLGAFYMRLVGRAVDVYQYLEPLYNDFRKVRVRDPRGNFQLSHIDQVIDDMLRKDYCFDIALPRLPARKVLEETGQLEPRISVLQDEFDEQALQEEKEDAARRANEEQEAAAPPLPNEEQAAPKPAPSSAQVPMDVDSDSRGRGRLEPARKEGTLRRRSRSRSPWRMSKEEQRADRDRRRGGDGHRGRERYRNRSSSRQRRRGRSRSDSSSRRRRRQRSREREGSRSRRKRRTSRSPSRSPTAYRRDQERSAKEGDELEIIEANKLRASLGLKPLRM